MKELKAFINKDVLKRMHHNNEKRIGDHILIVLSTLDKDLFNKLRYTIFQSKGGQSITVVKIDDMKKIIKNIKSRASLFYHIKSDLMEALNFAVTHNTSDYDGNTMFERIGFIENLKLFLDAH